MVFNYRLLVILVHVHIDNYLLIYLHLIDSWLHGIVNLVIISFFGKKLQTISTYFFFEEFVLVKSFSYSGGLQFRYDMKALASIFRDFTNVPDNYFQELKEAHTILSLPTETFTAFRTKMQKIPQAIPKQKQQEIVFDFLRKFGINKLTVEQVKRITEGRIH